MLRFIFFIVIDLIHLSVFSQSTTLYEKEISQWDSSRKAYLISDNGWLNLIGLLWLSEGRNSFGSDKSNHIIFPAKKIAANAGYFELADGTVIMFTENVSGIKVNGKNVTREIIFQKDSAKIPVCSSGTLRWTIKRSDDKYGIRLRDLEHPAVKHFKGIERFPVDSMWRVTAYLDKKVMNNGISITNVLGQTTSFESPGKLIFSIFNKPYSLDALWEGEELYIIFGDETTGTTTYPSGRYLYAKKPDASGHTILDFNKAFNPPCAFTEFATCPLPPKQNYLPIAITAGEKEYKMH
jgi:uncharacterized protein